MQTPPAAIPARNERQAMDWSLVLISQGIDAVIERDPETSIWRLLVNPVDYPRAMGVIREYRAENRPTTWQQQLPWSGLIFDWRCLFPIIFFVFLYAVENSGRGALNKAGMMDNQAVHAGAWWRLFTAVTLHGDMAHLAANATTALILLGLAMGTYGAGVGLLTALLAGVGGNLAGLIFYPASHHGLGASGMIMGALGLLAAQWVTLFKSGLTPRELAIRGVLSGTLLLVLLGFNPQQNVDILAHIAGFVTGVILGTLLAFLPPKVRTSDWLNGLSGGLCAALIFISWWMALRAFGRV